jgi:hypothetical protein
MSKSYWTGLLATAVALQALTGCEAELRPFREVGAPSPSRGQIVGVWRFPGGDAPPFDMNFNANGNLVFHDGFEHFNPASWHYDPGARELRLTLNTSEKWITDFETTGWAIRVNVLLRQVFLRLAPDQQEFSFCGWVVRKENG